MPAFDRVRPLAVLAPILCAAGQPAVAQAALEGELEALGPGESPPRTRTALACVLHRSGDEAAGHAALAAAFEEAGDMARFILRSEWPQVEEVLWSALEAGALDAAPAVEALDAAFPGGPQIVALAHHPQPRGGRGRACRRRGRGPPGGARTARRRQFRQRAGGGLRDRGRAGPAQAESASARVPDAGAVRDPPRRLCGGREPLGAQGGGARGALPAGPRRRAGSRGRAARGLRPEKPPGSARRGLKTAISSARAVLDLPWEQSPAPRRGTRLRAHPARRRPPRRRRLRSRGPPRDRGHRAGADRGDGGRNPAVDRRAAPGGALLRLGRKLARAPQLPPCRRAWGSCRCPQPSPGITPRRLGRRGRSSTLTRWMSTPSGC